MARINTYTNDADVNGSDKLLGTDSSGSTKNYTLSSIGDYFSENNVVAVGGQVVYKFVDAAADFGNGTWMISSSGGAPIDLEDITTIYINKNLSEGGAAASLLNQLFTSSIKIYGVDNVNVYGVYDVTAVVDSGTAYEVTVAATSFNGTLVDGAHYAFVANAGATVNSLEAQLGNIDSDINIGKDSTVDVEIKGKLGIGTASPDSPLEIYSASATEFLKLTSGGGAATPIKLVFEKSSAEQGIIEYNRNGDLEIYNTDGDGGVMINGRNSADGDLYISNGGNVGIGTTSPEFLLSLDGSASNKIAFQNGSGSLSDKAYIEYIKSGNDTNLTFGTTSDSFDALERMRITHDGKVGIGTTAPTVDFEVAGNGKFTGSGLYVGDVNSGVIYYNAHNTTHIAMTSSLMRFKVDNKNFIQLNQPGWPQDEVVINEDSADIDFRVEGNGDANLLVTNAGTDKVGIGTNSPAEKLEVSGNIKLSNNIKLDRDNEGAVEFGIAGTMHGASGANEVFLQKPGNSGRFTFGTQTNYFQVEDGNNTQYIRLEAGSKPKVRSYSIGTLNFQQHSSANNNSGDVLEWSNGIAANGQRGLIKVAGDLTLDDYSSGSRIEKIRLKNDGSAYLSGNVGIGTTSPSYKLQVNGTARFGDGSPYLKVTSSSVEVEGSYLFAAHQSGVSFYAYESVFRGLVRSDSSGSNALKLGDTTERMRIVGGSVGIGTTSPSEKLHIYGGRLILDNAANAQSAIQINSAGVEKTVLYRPSNSNDFRIYTSGGGDVLAVNNTGNVGIGTTTPDVELEVEGTIKASTHGDGFIFGSPTTVKHKIGVYGANDLLFKDPNNNVLMTLTAGGNLGVATTAPQAKLHVKGSFNVDKEGYGQFGNINGGGVRVFGTEVGTNGWDGFIGRNLTYNYTDSEYQYISTNANNYWGTVAGMRIIGTGNDSQALAFIARPATDEGTNIEATDLDNYTRMSIKYDGNVGIGTTSPAEKLDVNGNIKAAKSAGIYVFSDTVDSDSSEDIFSLSNTHGAQAFRVTFVCSTDGYSVAKTFEVVHSWGNEPAFFKVVDTGVFSGHDFDVAFADVSNTGVKATITNNSTTKNADIVTTVFLGGSPTDITVTAL